MKSISPFIRTGVLVLTLLLAGSAAPHAFAANTATVMPEVIRASKNWAGYVATQSGYTGVEASWIVPAPAQTTSRELTADATWVGIGGASTSDLIQAGTQALMQNGDVVYQAWYEILPAAQVVVPLPVHAGDFVSVALEEMSPNVWHIMITNNTTGVVWQNTLYYESSRSSVEWIVERPLAVTDTDSRYLSLNDFDSVNFMDASALVNGEQVSLSQLPVQKVAMTDGESITAAPSNTVSSNGAFTVSYLSERESRDYLRQYRRSYRDIERATLIPETTQSAATIRVQFSY